MKITDQIRSATSEHEIRSLLKSYLDAVRGGGQPGMMSQVVTVAPLAGLHDVNRRIGTLLFDLDAASKRLDDRSCRQIKEALRVFAMASDRWQCLAAEQRRAVCHLRQSIAPKFPAPPR